MFRCSTFFFLCQHWHRNSKRIACDIHRMCVFFSCWQNRDPSRNITWKYKSNSAKFSEHDKFNYCHCTTYTRQATSPYISDSLCSVWCTECPRSTISFVSESFWSVWWIKCPRSHCPSPSRCRLKRFCIENGHVDLILFCVVAIFCFYCQFSISEILLVFQVVFQLDTLEVGVLKKSVIDKTS